MGNPKVLFLDDSDIRRKAFRSSFPFARFASTVDEMVALLSNAKNSDEFIDWVFLDHDLGGEENCHSYRRDTGMEVVRWICKHKPEIGRIIIHSCNRVAAWSMVSELSDEGFSVHYIPYTQFQHEFYGKELCW